MKNVTEEDIAESQELIDFIAKSPSVFHAVENIAQMFEAAGYSELKMNESWHLSIGGHYFVRQNGTAIVAFNIPANLPDTGFRMIASHSDSPTFRVKPSPEISSHEGKIKLNVEGYGGSLLYSWLDRPLSLAGRVVVASDMTLRPTIQLVDFERPVGVIPSVAIHMNRGVNENLSLNKQTDMQIFVGESLLPLTILIAQKLCIDPDDILDYDLTAYDPTPGCIAGFDYSIISCPKLDNLMMAYTSTKALLATDKNDMVGRMLLVFDNEEVGSCTKQGAASPFAKDIIMRISETFALAEGLPQIETYQRIVYNSFMVSADMAHAVHPNHPELQDPKLHPVLGGGPVVKYNASQKYMSDADSAAVFIRICQDAGVPCQKFVNRSDMAGGSTLGNILTQQIALRGVDVGGPILGMHSSHETGDTRDTLLMRKAFEAFFEHIED